MDTLTTLSLIRELEDIGITDRKQQDRVIAIILPFEERQQDEIFDTEKNIEYLAEQLQSAVDNAMWEVQDRKRKRLAEKSWLKL